MQACRLGLVLLHWLVIGRVREGGVAAQACAALQAREGLPFRPCAAPQRLVRQLHLAFCLPAHCLDRLRITSPAFEVRACR